MTKRNLVINQIISEIAHEGQETSLSMRLYIENRISYEIYKKAVQKGLSLHSKNEVQS